MIVNEKPGKSESKQNKMTVMNIMKKTKNK